MSDSVIIGFIIGRSLATIAAITGAVYLSANGKEGWGWLIFVAICVGCYSITSGD